MQGSLGLLVHYGAGILSNKDVQREKECHGLSRIYGLLWGMGLLVSSIQDTHWRKTIPVFTTNFGDRDEREADRKPERLPNFPPLLAHSI